MKNILFILSIVVSTISFSQTFNGVQLGLPYSTTKTSLINKGFTYKSNPLIGMYVHVGKVMGKNSEILVMTTPTTKKVWAFSVIFDDNYSWVSVKDDYQDYKKVLTEKYGQPTDSLEIFVGRFCDGCGNEFEAISSDNGSYKTVFETPEGLILLDIESDDEYSGNIKISYINIKTREQYNAENKAIQKATL